MIDGGARPKPLESEPNEDGVVVVTRRDPAPSLDCTSFPYVVVLRARSLEEPREVVPTILTRAEALTNRRLVRLRKLRLLLPRRLSRLLLSVFWMSRLTWMRRTSSGTAPTL